MEVVIVSECNHKWIANSGQGGEPSFKGRDSLMHVKCEKCNGRTWMTQMMWESAQAMKTVE